MIQTKGVFKELVSVDEEKYYSLTPKGEKKAKEVCKFFAIIFMMLKK